MNRQPEPLYRFGDCRLDLQKKVLWHKGEPVSLPLKAVELLSVLVEKRGEVVTKDEIWRSVWQDAFVEETNLTHNIYLLRKTLKELGQPDLILTVPRRGYRFAGGANGPANANLVIEKHSITQTLVEEMPVSSVIPDRQLISANPRRIRPVIMTAILAFALVGSGFLLWRIGQVDATPGSAAIRSIAVVPLSSVNDGADDRSLSLGFADALRTSLGNLEGIRIVSARATGMSANHQSPDAAQLGRDLAVDSVLEGTLQRANGKLRVMLRLIRSSDGVQIWSGSFDESETDIFALQDEMARQTAAALSRDLHAGRPATQNRDAYHAYLRGRFFFDKRQHESYQKAIVEFTRALELDPRYALAYAGLADVYAMQANTARDTKRRDELYESSRTMATNALALDETSAEAHTSLAWIKRVHDWDWEGSEREFKRAIELNGNYANARQWYAFLLLGLGRMDEAVVQMDKALELEPLSRIVLNNSFTVRNYRGETDMLPSIAERVTAMDDSEPAASWIRSLAYSRTGQHLKVIEVGESYHSRNGGKIDSDYLASNLAIAYARTGQDTKSAGIVATLQERAKTDFEAAFRLAQAYAELERTDEAIELLRRCLKARDDRMVWIKTEPRFTSLRSDPRFQEILRTMRLP